jgi:trehalose 6-phosphate phosphatase
LTDDPLAFLRERPGESAILLDFDGTLSEIVPRPDLAAPVDGARDAVAALVARYAVVAVVSGRPSDEVAGLLGVEGVRYAGLYGADDPMGDLSAKPVRLPPEVLEEARSIAAEIPEAWVEPKDRSVAVHYRQAPDPAWARDRLRGDLLPVARRFGLDLVEGKKVVELLPSWSPRKGQAVERIAAESGCASVLYAGDDLADVEAFEALERLSEGGVATIRVAVAGSEPAGELVEAADIVVEDPSALVELLRDLL